MSNFERAKTEPYPTDNYIKMLWGDGSEGCIIAPVPNLKPRWWQIFKWLGSNRWRQ